MPFITQERRVIIDEHGLRGLADIEPGDRCYVFYKRMVDEWKASPRWSTVHRIAKDFLGTSGKHPEDDMVAVFLALGVFFQLYVMPYEKTKIEENGDI